MWGAGGEGGGRALRQAVARPRPAAPLQVLRGRGAYLAQVDEALAAGVVQLEEAATGD